MFFMFKLNHLLVPAIFNSMFILNGKIHDYFTRQLCDYHLPKWRLEIKRRSIYVQGPLIWNKLANNFDINCTVPTFKFHVKSYLLENEVQF